MEKAEIINEWLHTSVAIVIAAGAGMGVDSGLADYRGSGGQWGKIESLEGTSIFDVINPTLFQTKPKFAWNLYATRLIQYSDTHPHLGFGIIQKWIKEFALDYFVLTSNVDNQFQKAGFDGEKIRELHGSIFYMQCSKPCSTQVWKHDLDLAMLLAEIEQGIFPRCPYCGSLSRPNVYMFRDNTYISGRSDEQKANFVHFLENKKVGKMIVLEIGAGPHVQSVRAKTRMLGNMYKAKIVRINPKDERIKGPHISIRKGALDALIEIDRLVGGGGSSKPSQAEENPTGKI